jgi:hypothetical protein
MDLKLPVKHHLFDVCTVENYPISRIFVAMERRIERGPDGGVRSVEMG